MHIHNPLSQQPLCLICHKPIRKEPSLFTLVYDSPICASCLAQFEPLHYVGSFHDVKLTILYRYNAFFQTLLFRYKGQYDYELRNAFIVSDQRFLSDYYRSHVIVVAPSDDIANKKRGFIPTAGIASSFSSNIFTGLYKKSPFKQAEQSFESRQKIKDVIDIKNGEVLRKKKVLLFDDVITSGSTLEKCLDLVCHYHPASIEIVILATRSYHLEKNI